MCTPNLSKILTLTDHYFGQSGYRSSTIALFCEDLEMEFYSIWIYIKIKTFSEPPKQPHCCGGWPKCSYSPVPTFFTHINIPRVKIYYLQSCSSWDGWVSPLGNPDVYWLAVSVYTTKKWQYKAFLWQS